MKSHKSLLQCSEAEFPTFPLLPGESSKVQFRPGIWAAMNLSLQEIVFSRSSSQKSEIGCTW